MICICFDNINQTLISVFFVNRNCASFFTQIADFGISTNLTSLDPNRSSIPVKHSSTARLTTNATLTTTTSSVLSVESVTDCTTASVSSNDDIATIADTQANKDETTVEEQSINTREQQDNEKKQKHGKTDFQGNWLVVRLCI